MFKDCKSSRSRNLVLRSDRLAGYGNRLDPKQGRETSHHLEGPAAHDQPRESRAPAVPSFAPIGQRGTTF
jgi:hypothetical protein